ncbi:MAG TPA: hypothetical protein VJ260_05715 [Vicinamibacterales bacterium]|nr:hypothetical protein [Vicinamibacterales bacterium]
MNKIAPYGKALTGAIVACLSYLQPAVDDGLTPAEMIGAAVAFLTGLAVVWAIPNRDPEAAHQDESVQPPHDPETFSEFKPENYV